MKKQVRSQIGNINQKAQFNSSFLNKSAIDIFQILLTKPIISISPSSAGCSFGCASPTLDPTGPNGQMKSRDPHQKLPRPPGSVKLRGSPLFSPRSWGQITHRFGMYQTAPPPLADHVDKRDWIRFFESRVLLGRDLFVVRIKTFSLEKTQSCRDLNRLSWYSKCYIIRSQSSRTNHKVTMATHYHPRMSSICPKLSDFQGKLNFSKRGPHKKARLLPN